MELRQLHQFVAIAETGSYRRAAERLFIAQPALSVSIQKLEHSLGAVLFERGVKGVTLTRAGAVLLARARRTLLHAEQTRRAVRLAETGEFGALRLGFVGSATYALLPAAIPKFRGAHPGIELVLQEDSTLGLLALLEKDLIDAAVVRGPVANSEQFESTEVERDDFVLALNAAHPLGRRQSVALRELCDDPFIMYAPHMVPGLSSVALSLCGKAGFAPIVKQEAVQVQTVVSLVASGMGIALVPAVTRLYSNPHVNFVALRDGDAKGAISLSLVVHKSADFLPVRQLLMCMKR